MAEVAVGKRIKISKIQQHIMLAVLGTSLIFGVSAVFAVFFVKYIIFNTTVISAKDEAINNYYSAIKNVGICKDDNKDGKYTDKELKDCDPESIEAEEIPDTLRNNVLVGMASNNDLESVARDSQESCFGPDGDKIDFVKSYQSASTAEERAQQLYMYKVCSSLRVVPDALPAFQNEAALLSSINQIFLLSGFQPEALSPSSAGAVSPVNGLEVIPISISVEENVEDTTKLLENLEKSIRAFSFQTATITWRGSESGRTILELAGQALAFYTNEVEAAEEQKTVYASPEAKKTSGTSTTGMNTVEQAEAEVKGE